MLKKIIIITTLFFIPITKPHSYKSQPDSMQDKFLNEHVFFGKKNGFFVDIGAHDGETYSNTYIFEKKYNWRGICIEPLQETFAKLQKNRSCTCLNTCISTIDGQVNFLKVADHPKTQQNMLSGMLHTYDPRHLKRLLSEIATEGGSYTIIKMPSRRLDSLLKEYTISHIDYLSIDVEGGEKNVLESIDFNAVYIYAISIENNYNDPFFKSFLTDPSRGFKFLTKLGGDEIYINTRARN